MEVFFMLIGDKQVPVDMISQIFRSGLSMSDLGRCRRVCSLFKEIIDAQNFQAVWKNGLKMDYEVVYNDYNRLPDEIKINWQGCYIQEYDSQKALKNAEANYEKESNSENLYKWGELLLKREDRTKNSRAARSDPWMMCPKKDRDKAIQCFLATPRIEGKHRRLEATFARLMCYSPQVGFDAFYLFKLLNDLAESGYPTVFEDLGLCYLTGRGIGIVFQMREKALEYIQRSANLDIPSSIFLCAVLHEHNGNEAESLKYMQMAADLGIKEAQIQMANHHQRNPELNFEYFRKAALQGHEDSQCATALYYKYGVGTEPNAEQCLSFAKKSAELGNAQALCFLGECYEEGFGVPKDLKEAFEYYKLSATKNHVGQFRLALCYYKGIGTSRDLTEALRYAIMAAESGYIQSQCLVVEICQELSDFSNMFKYAKLAAESGDASCQSILGAMLHDGLGTDKDPKEALKYFMLAAEQDQGNALFSLGLAHLQGEYIERNDEQMFNYFRRAVEAGIVQANLYLGACYEEGFFVEKDPAKAFHHYKIAADNGDVNAQLYVGVSFFHGKGVEPDKVQAFRYVKMAADKGVKGANFRIGECYEDGDGIEKIDLFMALKFYERAADQGHRKSQIKVAEFYREGKGCIADPIKAEMYEAMAETKRLEKVDTSKTEK